MYNATSSRVMAVTKAEIDRALDDLARLMADGRVSLLPLHERLEQELARLEQQETALDRARRRSRRWARPGARPCPGPLAAMRR
jgi:hypothetical protein